MQVGGSLLRSTPQFSCPNRNSVSFRCSGLIATAICLYSLSCTSGNCLILHSLIRVSDCSKKVAWLMALGALTMHSITFVFTCIAIKQVLDGISFARMGSFEICALMETPSSFLGAFAPAVALDCYSFALLLLNALSRPRNTSQRLLRMLLKDGLVYFLVCLSKNQIPGCILLEILNEIKATRILNIIMSTAVPTALVFVSWGIGFDLNAAVTARLYLRMCETDFSPNSGYGSDSDVDGESSISSFIDSLSDEGGLMEIKD
ncbi:hypothetical protein SCHPADRAFT_492311 [Schizopora paradoxa]|uniref:Uncharacterized protein n=1 Tax=Schizopora paradoxa TaxID=27342 RepID=A0A0H2RGN0_9AGAM|nr:hypothetical protein SCHPADRAFT_492311 [Schizopora paradoxa]